MAFLLFGNGWDTGILSTSITLKSKIFVVMREKENEKEGREGGERKRENTEILSRPVIH